MVAMSAELCRAISELRTQMSGLTKDYGERELVTGRACQRKGASVPTTVTKDLRLEQTSVAKVPSCCGNIASCEIRNANPIHVA